MGHESTMVFVTNLDRAGIEAQLLQVRKAAVERNLADVAALLAEVQNKSRVELDQLITRCIQSIRATPHKALCDQLEMLQMNLPNLG